MLWWFLILGVSAAVVVSVAVLLYVRLRQQLNAATARRSELESLTGGTPERDQ